MEKVSIVSACYNGEQYIHRFLDAILNQSYPMLQLIVVDDGSNDATLSILNNYKAAFAKRNIEYIVLAQENGGQAKALNMGFPYADGEYLTWPDTDDFLFKDSISKRVRFLNEHPEYGMVLSNGNEYDEGSLETIRSSVVSVKQAENLFDCMLDMTAIFNNNGYLVRSDLLWRFYPNRKIYEGRAGQNIQILLPLSSECKCGYISEPLYGRTLRRDSHSKRQKDAISRMKQVDDVYFYTIPALEKSREYAAAKYSLGSIYSKYLYYLKDDFNIAKAYCKQFRSLKRSVVGYECRMILHYFKSRVRMWLNG